MRTSLIIADNFDPQPEALREAAMASDFGTYPFQGHSYKGVGGSNQNPIRMEMMISRILGPIHITLSFFRLGTPENEPTTYIHADPTCAKWAVVLYLNTPEQCRGGTAFWKHKATGLEEVPFGKPVEFYESLNRDGNDESKWDLVGLAGMRWNRAVFYTSEIFHSRYPQAGWGTGPADGRLIWTAFFNRLGDKGLP